MRKFWAVMWNGKYLWRSWLRRETTEHRWSPAGSGSGPRQCLHSAQLHDDLGVVPGTGSASFQNNKFLPELFQTDHNQARPAGNADTASLWYCHMSELYSRYNWFIASAQLIPHHLWCQYIKRQQRHKLHSHRGMAQNWAHMMSKLDDITQASESAFSGVE